MSGVFPEVIGLVICIALAGFLYWDAGLKISYKVLVPLGIVLVAGLGFLLFHAWGLAGF